MKRIKETRARGLSAEDVLHQIADLAPGDVYRFMSDRGAECFTHIRIITKREFDAFDTEWPPAALPPTAEDWRIILGVGEYATLAQVDAAFLEKAKTLHPDVGGSHEDMARLTAARDLARKVLS